LTAAVNAARRIFLGSKAIELATVLEKAVSQAEHRWMSAYTSSIFEASRAVDPVLAYVRYWDDLLGMNFTSSSYETWAGSASAALGACGLDEAADYASDTHRLASYAVGNLLPHIVADECPGPLDAVIELLERQLARWYFEPEALTPVVLAARVLFAGRPFYYERIIAHAVVQHQIFHEAVAHSFESELVLAHSEEYLARLIGGYAIRRRWAESRKSPAEYTRCIADLVEVHYGCLRPRDREQARKVLALLPGAGVTVH
jgi:hypothetical protein